MIIYGRKKAKRPRRTPQERVADIDSKIALINGSIKKLETKKLETKKQVAVASIEEKIAAAQERIKVLEVKKANILNPKPSSKTEKQKIQEIMKQVQENGLKPEEIAERLGITITM
mgnify:CR=1 FL=1